MVVPQVEADEVLTVLNQLNELAACDLEVSGKRRECEAIEVRTKLQYIAEAFLGDLTTREVQLLQFHRLLT